MGLLDTLTQLILTKGIKPEAAQEITDRLPIPKEAMALRIVSRYLRSVTETPQEKP